MNLCKPCGNGAYHIAHNVNYVNYGVGLRVPDQPARSSTPVRARPVRLSAAEILRPQVRKLVTEPADNYQPSLSRPNK